MRGNDTTSSQWLRGIELLVIKNVVNLCRVRQHSIITLVLTALVIHLSSVIFRAELPSVSAAVLLHG